MAILFCWILRVAAFVSKMQMMSSAAFCSLTLMWTIVAAALSPLACTDSANGYADLNQDWQFGNFVKQRTCKLWKI